MTFVRTLYILIVVFAENKEKSLVRCIVNLKETELVHLSQQLNPLECLQLVKAVYELSPSGEEREEKKYRVLNGDLTRLSATPNECLVNLEEWNNDFPKGPKFGGRSAMEMTLRWLGRPDLAKYVRENRRSIKFLDREDYDIADTLEFPGHKVSRRHSPENSKYSSAKGKQEKKKRGHQRHTSATSHKGIHRAMAAATGHSANTGPILKHFSHKVRELKKKENKSQSKKGYLEEHRSIYGSIVVVLFFIVLCLVAAYFLHRRNLSKTRGTRFKYSWLPDKKDKDTLTDHIEWNDEPFCSCSDVEVGCTGKCATCSRNYQILSDVPNKHVNSVCVQKPKDRKRKKRQRFSFLQKCSQDKKREKDQENRDRKSAAKASLKLRNASCAYFIDNTSASFHDLRKTLEKCVTKKREKHPIISQGDYRQCACCKCNLSSKEKMIRERKENEKRGLYKLKPKRKKEKRRKEDLRRVEKYGNVCYRDTCK
ncbi:uncharacterized protein LOC128887708 [Hylaeus anthracinus]|uniref:uncharacterized protein LOC128887708 n=1 Tax=Hylaeus anthracinus TaxID=313031 RepID=UPI0023B9464A|nr:uncharacterized protein LOC128887708 [Hylaeus anthracinus]